MKKILNAFFLTMIALVTFSCSDVPSPYDINEGGSNENLVGTGTEEDPYDVASALVKADNTAIAWIYGYIVGGVVSDNSVTAITSPENVVFGTAGIRATTILVAASQDEKDYKNCLVVKLNGENTNNEVRTALNLQVNTSNLGKPVKIYGLLITKAFGRKGMTDTKAAILDGQKIGGEEEVPTDAYIYESFASSLGSFKSVSVSGTLSWYNDFSSAMVKGGSATEKFPSETWLVAPTIDLSAETAAYISFNHAINFADAPTIKNYHQLMISKDYTTDVAGATWIPLAITMASGNTFDFVNSGKVSIPAAFLGQSKVTVALKYTSTTTTGSTWEVQKFTVAHGEGGTIVDPIEPEFPTSGPGSKDEPYDVSTILTKQDDTKGWLKGFIVGGVNSAQTSATVDGPEDILFSVEGIRSSAIVIAASKDETDYKKCLVIGFGNDSGAAKTALNLVDHKDNLGKEVKLGGIFKNAFSAPGMKTITEYEIVEGGGGDPDPVETNLVVNPSFEDWAAGLPTAWDNESYNTSVTKETSVKHSGSNSVKHASGLATVKLQQEVAIEAGKKYKISYWFLDNDVNARNRMWSFWVDADNKTLVDNKDELRDGAPYSEDSPEWKQYSVELTAPVGAVKFRFEVRTYKGTAEGGAVYYDDMEISEVK